MNPELPSVQPRVETPQIPGGTEFYPGPDVAPQQECAPVNHEQQPSPQEMSSQAIAATSSAAPTVVNPVAVQPQAEDNTAAIHDTPIVAADEDLIEKEWVDKVKKIIALTRDDPHEKSRVIAQLQADYLKKRYNKTLGQSDE